ncbi:MAG TPA: cytochrome c family protein [Caulobacterales bacterium]|nr:cytochrome c family protein [Caulobacterales bacterium]
MADNTNAILGATLASVLGLMALGVGANAIFPPNYPEKPGFAPEVEAAAPGAGGPAAPAGPPDFGTIFANAGAMPDLIARGQGLARACASCHTFGDGEPNRIGPNLHDVFGRPAASHPGFEYSDAMKAHTVTWSYDTLDAFLTSPGTVVRGTKMTYAGIRRVDDRVAVIAYLRSISPHNVPLPPPHPPETAAAPAGEAPAAGAPPATTTTAAPNHG